MNRIFSVIVAVVAIVILAGCTTVNTNDAAITAPAVVKTKEFTPDIVTSGKATGTASLNCLFGFITWGVSEFADDAFVKTTTLPVIIADGVTVAKQGATYKACEAAKADYILGAKYRIDTQDYFVFKRITCTVTGIAGQLKGMK